MKHIAKLALAAYAVTFVVTSSSLARPTREKIKRATPSLRIGDAPHPIECRMCTGFWVSLAACLLVKKPKAVLPVYGASYFLATQER